MDLVLNNPQIYIYIYTKTYTHIYKYMHISTYVFINIQIYAYIFPVFQMWFYVFFRFWFLIVTWCPTEKIEIRLLLFPVRELTVASRQSKECGSEWRPTDVGTL